ncbi:MAG: hypothetical protein N2112_14870 [Gemmataceae bacterium]|jgi:tetratricopeptide (TPR) repeat protein|nr:hypothetical protein [Gemmataceae bacterium]
MAEPSWVVKYQAREALKNGRLEDARRLLDVLITSGYRRAWALQNEIAQAYLARVEKHLREDHIDLAWRDLKLAEELANEKDRKLNKLRETLINLGISEIRALLEAGQPLEAIHACEKLRERVPPPQIVSQLEEAARDWQAAIESADRGEFAPVYPALEKICDRIGPRTQKLDEFRAKVKEREERFKQAWAKMQSAADQKDWKEMLRLGDEILTLTPAHREAQQARNRAWQVLQPVPVRPQINGLESSAGSIIPKEKLGETQSPPPILPKRFFLWADGVGGFLVCLNPRVNFGQVGLEGPVDVPLFADIARLHASFARDESGYVLEAGKSVSLNGNLIDRAVLQSGDFIGFGQNCSCQILMPVPGSLTACIIFQGGRRLPQAADGVILMADSLIIGPGRQSHIRVDELKSPIYLLRGKDSLMLKMDGEFCIDGEPHFAKAKLPRQGAISMTDFAFGIEPAT